MNINCLRQPPPDRRAADVYGALAFALGVPCQAFAFLRLLLILRRSLHLITRRVRRSGRARRSGVGQRSRSLGSTSAERKRRLAADEEALCALARGAG